MIEPSVAWFRLACFGLLPVLCGCAEGREFQRPDLDSALQIGQTTEAALIERYGPPIARSASEVAASPMGAMPKDQTALVYGYRPPGHNGLALRLAVFGLKDGKLASTIFVSTFPADQRNFDSAAVVPLLAKPGLMQTSLVAAFGPPEGRVTGLDSRGVVERDAWYVWEHRNSDGRVSSERVQPTKVFTADVTADGRVVAYKLDVDDTP